MSARFEVSGYEEYAVVESFEVETRSKQGWYLIDVVQSTNTETKTVMVPVAVQGSGGSGGWINKEPQEILVSVARPLFVMGRKENQVVDELRKDIETQKKINQECAEKLGKLDPLTKELAGAKVELDESFKKINTIRKDWSDEQAKCRKLETDISKIRKNIGELKMKEILDTPTP